jgi:hypothetical protein
MIKRAQSLTQRLRISIARPSSFRIDRGSLLRNMICCTLAIRIFLQLYSVVRLSCTWWGGIQSVGSFSFALARSTFIVVPYARCAFWTVYNIQIAFDLPFMANHASFIGSRSRRLLHSEISGLDTTLEQFGVSRITFSLGIHKFSNAQMLIVESQDEGWLTRSVRRSRIRNHHVPHNACQ